jgi:hypothetical protein
MSVTVIALSADLTETVRRRRVSPHYDHPALVETAAGYGPCRSCLRPFRVGEEERLLFTLDPFRERGTLPCPGPVFIHRAECRRHEEPGFPPGLLGLPLLVEGYDRFGLPLLRRPLDGTGTVDGIERVLREPQVAFAHLRNAEAGCFVARVL